MTARKRTGARRAMDRSAGARKILARDRQKRGSLRYPWPYFWLDYYFLRNERRWRTHPRWPRLTPRPHRDTVPF